MSTIISVFFAATIPGAVHGASTASVDSGPIIEIEDVTRFYQVYDAARGHPSAEQLQRDYIDRGSSGLLRLARLRDINGTRIAETLTKDPQIYADAKRCMKVLPRVRQHVKIALRELGRLYPEAEFPPVTIVVGRGKPVGVTDATGVMIGLEALCAIPYLDDNVENRFVHVIAHEYAHVQQALHAPALYNDPNPTVLEESLIEGAAEFSAELTSGGVAYAYFDSMTKGHEQEIESAFAADEYKTDLSKWLYNGTLAKPGDLGYWVGYRIVKSYYEHAVEKGRAVREILQMTDPKAFKAKSGWYPGILLE
jgi:hypothetical protein